MFKLVLLVKYVQMSKNTKFCMSNLTFVHFMAENHFWESNYVQPKKRVLKGGRPPPLPILDNSFMIQLDEIY